MKDKNPREARPADSREAPPSPELDREKDLQLWSAKKWSHVTPPMRPSPAELAFYEKTLLEAVPELGATVLILGATPELRSLTLKHGLRTTGCDIDAGFWSAMTLLRTVEGEEAFIHGNWLDLEGERRFDLILGDCSLTMLTWEEMNRLVPRLGALLKDGGKSIQRILTANESLSPDIIEQAMDEYRKRDPGIPLNLYLFFLAGSLGTTHYPELTNRQFFESVVFPRLTAEEADRLRPFLLDRKFCYPWREDMTRLLESTFRILEVEESSGPGMWGTAGIYVLEKKGG